MLHDQCHLNISDDLVDFESLNKMDTIVHHSNEEEGQINCFTVLILEMLPFKQ